MLPDTGRHAHPLCPGRHVETEPLSFFCFTAEDPTISPRVSLNRGTSTEGWGVYRAEANSWEGGAATPTGPPCRGLRGTRLATGRGRFGDSIGRV
jgi:hypothetical protein